MKIFNQGIPIRRVPRILFLANVDWAFLSHRLPVARAARDRGAEIWVGAASTGCKYQIEREGFHFIPIPFSRSGRNPIRELITARKIVQLLRFVRPDLIHNVTIKPVLYGSILARIVHPHAIVNTITGLGYVFMTPGWKGRILRSPIELVYKFALASSHTRVIFQNPDDIKSFISKDLVEKRKIVLVRGSGVDVEIFVPSNEPSGIPVVMLASRLLKDKGVLELVEASRILKRWKVPCRVVLVGDSDRGNPTSISENDLRSWVEEGCIEWWGHKNDMENILSMSSIVVLPSYREGLPKVLLEAAAVGRPLVATDVPGCREIVKDGENGLLVPPRDASSLAVAIRRLVESPEERIRMGIVGRDMVVQEFRKEVVVESTFSVYEDLLGEKFLGFFSGPL